MIVRLLILTALLLLLGPLAALGWEFILHIN
jgi:hypothetical protein